MPNALSHVPADRVAAGLARVRERIVAAAARAGRDPARITLVGVTKTVDVPTAAALLAAGCADLGENRPEDLAAKAAAAELRGARWHLVGTYQRRKVRDTVGRLARLHSAHSADLLRTLNDKLAGAGAPRLPTLLEVNVPGDPRKQGFAPEALSGVLEVCRGLPFLHVDGLMTMARQEDPPEAVRATFAALRDLRDRVASADLPLPELSMGMSGDFEIAVEEGATFLRVGSALFA